MMAGVGVMVTSTLAVIFSLGGLVYAGSACLAGISYCTKDMHRQTSTASGADKICGLMEDYLVCITRLCSTSLTACDIQTAGTKLFNDMDSKGYVCRNLPDLTRLLDAQAAPSGVACAESLSSRHSSSSSPSSSSTSHSIELSTSLLFNTRLFALVVMATILRCLLSLP